MAEPLKRFMIEDARIIFRNFAGREIPPYNRKGDRNFSVILPEDVAIQMLDDGWNVKYLDSREEGEPDVPFVRVAVRYDKHPPRVVVLTDTTRTQLDEASVEILDWANIKTLDLIARGSNWSANGKDGIKAYLQSLFVTIEEDALEKKYAFYDMPSPDNFND
jgi:hypothetical protein